MGAGKDLDISGAKGGSDKPKSPTEAPDSLRSIAVAKMLIAMGEGEFAGNPTAQDIYLDNTPLQDPQGNMNFPNVKWEFRGGSVEQGYIQGIPSVENETTLGIELRSGTPWVRAISNAELSAVRLRFAWPALQSVDSSGNVNGYRIEYKVEVATDGGAYHQVLSEAVDGKTTSTYERTRRIDLPAASSGWLLRVTRITPNKNNNKIADTMQIAGFTEVIDAKLRYPNTALLYIEFSAEQFRNIPAVTVDCRARKWQVPSNYDPDSRTYNGIWDGTFKQAWTDNPAWVTYGITINDRFGLGRRIKPWQVDKWELYRIAQYCDQLVPDGKGGQEPRFVCNLNLQGKADAWSLLRDISAIYRGMTYWAQGQVFTLSDMPRATDFDFAYTRANVIDGKFTYSSSSERTRYSRALISYDNPANNYDTDVTAVTDAKLQRRYGDNPLEISAIGCTRESEAQRRGKWALLTNAKDRGITFKVGLDGRIPLPGYVIPVADELLAGRAIGGRISAVKGKVITLDRDTQAKAGDRLILNLPNGKCEGRTVQSVSGRKVTVTTVYSATPEPQLVWALDANDLAIPLYRVTSVSRPELGVFEITAIQYDPSKFAHIDTGARLEERPISVIPISVVPAPVSVTLTSNTIIAQGLAVTTMNITWPSVPGAVAYDVEWRKDSGNWIRVQRTGSTSVDVSGIYAGAYLARVRAVSAFDISSIWKSSSLTQLKGKVGLPPAVTLLTADSLLFGIGLKWGFPIGAEDTQRTEIWYGTTTSVAAATKLADLAYPQRDYSMQSLQAGAQFFFWARLIDRTGNVGPWYPAGMGVMGQASSDAGPILDQIAGQIGETELGKDILDRIELIDGPPTLPGSVNDRLKDLGDQVGEVTDQLQGQITDGQAALQEQIDQVSSVAKSAGYQKEKVYAVGASTRLNDRLYQAKIAVPADLTGAKAPPNATYWMDVGQVVSESNGLAARVNITETKITNIEGVNTAQGTSINGLQSSLTVTNGNVTAAQNAAQAASDLAGGKGKVITQSAAPAAADRLAQNLWIDTTGNANTPKRWSGSAWVAVTDKVATDAAAAAANALSVANTKADASVVNSLTNRVTSAEGTITSQGTALTGLNNSLTTTNNNVTAAQNAANAANTLAGGKGKVIVQASAPAAADQLVQNLWIDIAGGGNTPKRWTGSAWTPVTDKVATDAAAAAASALSQVATKAEAATVQALSNAVTQQGSTITAQGSAITSINTSLGNISQENLLLNPEWKVGGYLKTENGAGYTMGYANRGDAGVPAGAPNERLLYREVVGTVTGWGGSALVMQSGTIYTPAIAGEVVNVSCWMYCENPMANAGKISLTPVPEGGGSIAGWGNRRLFTYNNATGGWQRLTAQVTLPDATDSLSIYITPDTTVIGFKMWVSDLVVTKQSPEGTVLASATMALDARVTTTEGAITSQGTAITGLSNSLNTTNTNVMAAQNAAQAASDLAGGKGKVITQSAAPAAADRLAQNLWIDTTGNANTPKRWSGSAWVAVTDKVATDAAAAAASALSQVATKAEAATVQALSNTVMQQGNTITAQGSSLTSITATIGGMTQENIVLDPTFNVGKEAFNPSGAVTIVPRTDPSIPPNTPVPRVAKWLVPGSTTANTYIGWGVIPELRNPGSVVQMSVAAGEVYEFSADVFMEASGGTRQHGFWMQMYDATGTSVGHTWVPGSVSNKRGEWETLSGKITIAPTAVTGRVTFRMSVGEATNLWICNQRWTKQTAAQAANASAQSALDVRVTQAETGLTTQAGQIVALNTGVAGKADNSALQSLASTVTQQGNTLTSQGTAVTQLQSTVGTLGAKGTNLLPDLYSWLTSTTLPPITVSAISAAGIAVAAAMTGFGYKFTTTTAATGSWAMLSANNNAAGWNISLEAGSYLVSMYLSADQNVNVQVGLWNGSSRNGDTVAVTATRTRFTFSCVVPPGMTAKGAVVLWLSRSGISGVNITVDSVMVESKSGSTVEPSPFVAGPSAQSVFAQATAISSLDTRVTESEGVIAAQATKLDGIYVQVNPALAGDSGGFAGASSGFVGVWSEQSARIEDGVAVGKRVDTVQASVADNAATVQQVSQAQVALDGKASAMWSVKLQVNSQGQYVAAGVGLGIENTPAGLQSQFLVSADRFAVVNGINGNLSSPFAVQAGQVFINQAFIQDGSITNLKIGQVIQSDNYVAGQQGWILHKSGVMEFNGTVPGGGRLTITNRAVKVFDQNNVLRVQLGDLTA